MPALLTNTSSRSVPARTSAASRADLSQLGKVCEDGSGLADAVGVVDVVGGADEPAGVAAVQDQSGTVGCEPLREGAAMTVGGAGNEDRRVVGHVRLL